MSRPSPPHAATASRYRIRPSRSAATRQAADRPPVQSMRAGESRDFAAEIAIRPVDAFTEREANEPDDLDRRARLAFGLLHRLRDAFLVVEDEGLIEQANFLVEGL